MVKVLLFISCNSFDYNLKNYDTEKTLESAGNNREELERVLNYYKNKNDNLKYNAAKFLIANMSDHKSYNNIEFLNDNHIYALDLLINTAKEQYFLGVDKIKQKKEVWEKNSVVKKKLDSLLKGIEVKSLGAKKSDVKEIKGDWLIKHIDKAFENWNDSGLLSKNDFEEFLETFLPYRYANENLNVPKDYPKKIWKDLLKDKNFKDTRIVINTLNEFFSRIHRITVNLKSKDNLGFYNILKWKNITCDQQIIIAANILNDIGIPTHLDYTPIWIHRTLAHSWCVSKDSLGNYKYFSPFWQSIDSLENKGVNNKNYFKRVSKVFRRTYAIQEKSAVNFNKEHEDIPPFFDSQNWIDVTDSYHKTTTITINIKGFNYNKASLAYLAVFNPNGWQPIDWAVVNEKNHEVIFNKIPKNRVYNIVSYSKGKTTPISKAFYINSKGEISFIKPNFETLTNLKILKKYPQKELLYDFISDNIGGQFQGANSRNFNDAENLYTFKDIPKNYITSISIKSNKKYRYVRFKPPKNVLSNMAIMEFYENLKKGKEFNKGSNPYVFNKKDSVFLKSDFSKIKGKPIGNNRNASLKSLNLVFDGNMETYVTDKWIGLDFGEPKKIEEIRYAFRNANNRINVGDVYQLFYYDNGWMYLETKKAVYNFLEFKNVPSGTMYWLRNITKGKEELPFFYKNDKQYFMNYDDLNKSLN